MTHHKTKIEARAGRHTQFAFMESQHPIKPNGDMYFAREAIIAAYIGRDIEKRLLVEGAVSVLRPAVLIAV